MIQFLKKKKKHVALWDNCSLRMDNGTGDAAVEKSSCPIPCVRKRQTRAQKRAQEDLEQGSENRSQGTHSVQGDGQTEMRNGQGTGEVRDKMESKVSGEREKIFHG